MIGVDGSWFKDEHGRTLLLRGVNLGGSSKVPFSPDGATYRSEGFFNHRQVSFVGRPFPLEQADEHFSRLKRWGFDFLRFLVTWEAIEHAGPGLYDQAYLDYVYGIIRKAEEHGIRLFIDPHQDVWSRFSGGDGAPGWTFEKVGLDITKFAETGAAIVHQTHGDPFPRMVWPTNGAKLAAATMFTLFFGGSDFAPAM
ncbi:MAG: glycoside hydrolase family 5 protein [Anaerolineales bacterium]|nr:glycoside hydrolase family 5 protein [Anaerolineales bacterium]